MRPTVSQPSRRVAPAPTARRGTASASLTTPTDAMRSQPGDEPGSLADVMDGTTPQDPQQEEDQKFL